MKSWKQAFAIVTFSAATLLSGGVSADKDNRRFEVTITNITQGEIFTPIMVASHGKGVKLYELGSPASPELEMLAEGGDTQPLSDALKAAGALDVVTAADVLPPGQSVTLYVKMDRKNKYVSVASMLVPTNDGFFAVNGIRGSHYGHTQVYFSPAYDAGTEENDELCVNIPGPPFICAGEGFNPNGGEGYVYIHPGIQGGGDLIASEHDWRNPVAKISIRGM